MFLWSIELLPNFSCSSNIKILKRKKICLCNAMIEIDPALGVCLFLLLSLSQKT